MNAFAVIFALSVSSTADGGCLVLEVDTDAEETSDGFNTVIKIESSHTLICRGDGGLECKW